MTPALASLALAALAAAAPPPPRAAAVGDALATLARVPQYDELELSPDGTRVAWVAAVLGKDGRLPHRSRVVVADVATGRARRVTAGAGADADEAGIAWSPDGRSLAFLSDAGSPGQQQLYVSDGSGRAPRRLTSVKGGLAAPAFSRDGRRIALLHVEGERREGPAFATFRETGALEEWWAVQRVAIVDAAGGPLRPVSPEGLFVYEFDWAPDGGALAAVAARGPGDASWWTAELVVLPSGGGEARRLVGPGRQLAGPRFSPDGKAVAYVAGLMSDEGAVGGDVFLVPAAGGEPRNLTKGRRASACTLAWTGPDRLVAAEWADGGSAVAAIRPGNGAIEELWRGDERVGPGWRIAVSLSRDGGRSAVVRERFDRAPGVEVGPIGAWKPVGAAGPPVGLAGPARKLRWKTDVGEVQGWLLPPPAVDPAATYPLVVVVHGGPSSAVVPGIRELPLLLASRGYYVLAPNPRGSYGHGEAFTRANVRDFGGGDLRDVLAGVDAALAAAPIDPARVGVGGWSYGGFMAMWAVTQTDRFRAAVAGAGVSNWQSYYGTNRIDTWMIPFFGASVYDDPEAYRRCSAIEQVKKIRTPTLLLHGERDSEVPVTQSRELWKALRALGVPTQLVVYPDAGHVPRDPAQRRDRLERIVGWFDRWLAPAPQARR